WLAETSRQTSADTDARANRHTNADSDSDSDPEWRVTKLLARLRHRDGERRIEFGHEQRLGALHQWSRQEPRSGGELLCDQPPKPYQLPGADRGQHFWDRLRLHRMLRGCDEH